MFLAQGLTIRPLTGFDTGGVLLSLGDGAGNFAAPTFLPDGHFVPGNDIDVNPGLSNIRLADVNGDGRADLIFSYVDEDYTANPNVFYQGIAVQLGNGDGTFQAPQTLALYNSTTTASTMPVPDVVAITDLNHDNKPDLILVAETTPAQNGNSPLFTLEVALGNGNGTFGAPTPVTTNDVVPLGLTYGTQSVALAAVDMNGDGIPDLVTLGSSSTGSAQIAIALGNGDGSFKTPNKTNLGLSYAQQGIAIGDFNGDGKLDVGVMGVFGPIDTGIVFGNGDGTLGTIESQRQSRTQSTDLSDDGRVGNRLRLQRRWQDRHPCGQHDTAAGCIRRCFGRFFRVGLKHLRHDPRWAVRADDSDLDAERWL